MTPQRAARDPSLRDAYALAAMAEIPRLLGGIDRNPYRPTYGCLDRQYWHYRTSSFPSAMYQEGAISLALAYALPMPGNQWHGNTRIKELVVAAIRFAAASGHRDGSCDDYYPFERALGAAVFSLQAAAHAYQVLELNEAELLAGLCRRAHWVANHDESGHLANHQALAALGLLRVAIITGQRQFRQAAECRLRKLLDWQSDEGWFDEYGGADPGYQTVTIECLAEYRRLSGSQELDEPLRRAVAFARLFLHPDGSYGGEYGSRGTYHFYPHGFELLAAENTDAADLADGFLQGWAAHRQAHFNDDRLSIHRLASLIGAYHDWAPTRPVPAQPPPSTTVCLPIAGLIIRRAPDACTVVAASRGGVFKHFPADGPPVTDAGLILQTGDGRVAVSQAHDRRAGLCEEPGGARRRWVVSRQLDWARFETATPLKQALLHTAMTLGGRWCRTWVRRLLQRRLITGRKVAPIRLSRTVEFCEQFTEGARLRVTDVIELLDPRVRIRRMSYGTDHQTAYVAACGVYQSSVLQPWTDLASYVEPLNTDRRVTIVRQW